jgi:hypothetical protein
VGKKQHTLKNTVMSLPDKFIVFLGRTFSGHNHDYTMLKQEFPPEFDWFTDLHIGVDLGYLGIQADYRGDQIDIPSLPDTFTSRFAMSTEEVDPSYTLSGERNQSSDFR